MSKSKNPLKGVKIPSDPDENFRLHAFRLGLAYLGAGRFAVAARFAPASGNLLHGIGTTDTAIGPWHRRPRNSP